MSNSAWKLDDTSHPNRMLVEHLVVDQDAEPADVDRFLDALDRLVERRLSQRTQNETGGPGPAARSDVSTL